MAAQDVVRTRGGGGLIILLVVGALTLIPLARSPAPSNTRSPPPAENIVSPEIAPSDTLSLLLAESLVPSDTSGLPVREVLGIGPVRVWSHYEKHTIEYGSDFVEYFFSGGPRQQRDCQKDDLTIQWYPLSDDLYGVALFGLSSRLLVTAIPMHGTQLVKLLRKSGCPDFPNGTGFALP